MALPERVNAMPYNCGLCDGAEQAVFLITPLSGADTMAVGNSCAPVMLMSMLSTYVDVPTDKIAVAVMGLTDNGEQTPERINLPTGYVYGPDGDMVLSEDDVDAGLCGYIHDDWMHCHRKAKHAGKHGRAEAFPGESAQPIEPDMPPPTAPGGES